MDKLYQKKYRTVEESLTPTSEEQTILILQGKCPHNKGWKYDGHSHNDDSYSCNLCGVTEWI